MRISITKVTNLLRILCLAAVMSSPHAAAQVDTSDWQCQYCPFPSGYDAEVDVGASYVSDDAARFGNASGYDEKGAYVNLGGAGQYVSDGYQLNWFAEDLGLDSRVFEIDGGRQGQFGFYLGYNELPYRLFDSTSTVFTSAPGDMLLLPSGWVPASLTSGFTALATSLQKQNIESDRQTLAIGGDYQASSDFSFFVDYRHQERDGVDIVSGSSFVQASLLPRVLDYQTDLVDAGVAYSKGALDLSLAWYGSFFQNKAVALTWDNPFTTFPGAEQGRLAQEPDNNFQQVTLSGNYRAETLDTVVAFSVAIGQGEQTDSLLPYTINPTIAASPLPMSNLDGKVDTASYALKLTSRPVDKGRIRISYRFDERDNQTAQATWSRVVVDSFSSGDAELNTPYSFERTRISASGDYELFDNLRISAGYDRNELDRDFQEVAEQTENSGWGRARWRPLDWLDITAKGGASKREIDRYDESLAMSFGQNPLLRKYNLAYRYREFGEVMISASPAELPISGGVYALFADDSYSQSLLGLTDSKNTHIALDLSWAPSEQTTVYFVGGREEIDADQSGSALFGAPDWFATHRDAFSHYGGGIELRGLLENTDILLDYTHTDGETNIWVDDIGSSARQFPELESTLDSLRLKFRYNKSDRLDIDLAFRYESFSTRDWALAGVEPDTISTILTLGADPYDYDVWVVGLGFRYLIGDQ